MIRSWDQDEARVFVEGLFAKHHGEIYAYLVRMLRDGELAADLTQDAFVKAYKNYDTLEKDENARAWLYQIAHRVALDELRVTPRTFEGRLGSYRPGEIVRVHAFRRDELLVVNVTLAAPPADTCVLSVNDDRAAATLRRRWLSTD